MFRESHRFWITQFLFTALIFTGLALTPVDVAAQKSDDSKKAREKKPCLPQLFMLMVPLIVNPEFKC